MDEYVMYEVRNYQNFPMMRFVVNVILYAFRCDKKENWLL